ncbi:MAG TPA: hypothetical protein VHC92_04960 [Rhodanobacteraceae bacterium]|nr:hypothetical protein [Rhodanobacteraceae bacterium]
MDTVIDDGPAARIVAFSDAGNGGFPRLFMPSGRILARAEMLACIAAEYP